MNRSRIALFTIAFLFLTTKIFAINMINAENDHIEPTLALSELPTNFKQIGYYVNSSSTFSNSAFHLMKYSGFGNSLVSFKKIENLSRFSMAIIPFKENWNQAEINNITNFVNDGGMVLLSAHVPSDLLNISTTNSLGFWTAPTETLSQSVGDRSHLSREINYQKALAKVSGGWYPFDVIRVLKYITEVNENEYSVLQVAATDKTASEVLGYSTISKPMGEGLLVYSTIPFFDLLGQTALGAATVPINAQTGTVSGRLATMVNRLITQLFLLHEELVPIRWHTPYGKIALINSRDDVDSYLKSTLLKRGTVDQASGFPSIFYELTDNILADDWNDVLNVSSEYPLGYHIPGYHRHTGGIYNETSAQGYLNRVLDIEEETGRPLNFECHHGGGGSGFFGKGYVRSAIEATNSLNHFVVYTSGEGGRANMYVEPYLYSLPNGTLVKSKNYYSLPKMTTIDSFVSSNSVIGFKERILNSVFTAKYMQHAHWLLHSQNVISRLTTNYNNFLNQIIDPIYEYLYTDPIKFVQLNLAYVESVTSSFKANNTMLHTELQVSQNIDGYTLAIPINKTFFLSEIKLNDVPIELDSVKVIHNGNSRYMLFYLNLTQGIHNLEVKLQTQSKVLSVDIDNDGVLDYAEIHFFGTSPAKFDSDNDSISDGDEIYVYETLTNDLVSTTPTTLPIPSTTTTIETIISTTTTNSSNSTSTSRSSEMTSVSTKFSAVVFTYIGLMAIIIGRYKSKKK